MPKSTSFIKKMFFPFLILSFDRESAKNALFDGIENTKDFVKSADWRDKDVYMSNMNLAEHYYNEKKFFDAKIRYRFAAYFNKKAIEPLLGLAYVDISNNKYKKAIKHLKKALSRTNITEDITEIKQLIQALELKK